MSTTKVCAQCGTVYDLAQKFCPNDGSPLRLQSADDPLIGQLIADRYQIVSLIGEGGMGRVYLAEHVRMGRKSAVKVINPALATTADAIARFNREAANACKINHPNVAQVYDFGEMADGTLYLAMEFIEGETLDAVIAREGPLPVARAASIVKQVADALFAAHHLDIVHRDLKPENVMVARHLDGSDWVKVVDFGIAKTVQRDGGGSQTVTTAGVSLGTPEYMSPEQLAGERLDHRTDIYSLGLVLFNALTNELPYPKLTSKETLVRRLTSKPRTLAEVQPGAAWPAGLQDVLDRALAPEQKDRFDSVADFGREVMRVVEKGGAATVPVTVLSKPAAPSMAPTVHHPVAGGIVERPERPLPHRRALPWVIATTSALVAVAAIAMVQLKAKREDPAVVVLQQPAPAPVVAAPAVPAPTPPVARAPDTAKLRRESSTPPKSHAAPPTTALHPDSLAGVTRSLGLVDSVTRGRSRLSPEQFARVDSMLGRLLPQLERLRSTAARTGDSASLGRHFWLRPNGDSTGGRPLPRSAPLEAQIEAANNEVLAHIARMRQSFDSNDVRRARSEFGAAATEIAMLHDLFPGMAGSTAALQRTLMQGARDVIVECYRKQSDSTAAAPSMRCDNLFAGQQQRLRELRRPPQR